MRLAGFPAAPPTLASARLRYHAIVRGLAAHGVVTGEGVTDDAQLVYIQKRLTPEIIEIARSARERGQRVWYDLDDSGDVVSRIAPPELVRSIFAIADLVTTGTDAQRELLAQAYGERPIHVFPNMIDYEPVDGPPPAPKEADPLRLLWFGYASNLRLLRLYLRVLAEVPRAEIVVVTNADGFRGAPPAVRFVPWSLESFTRELTASHVSCLMHDGTADDRAKTNTRMVTSIGWGVPAAISRTPEYERTAQECGVEDAIFDGPVQLAEVVERLRPVEARARYLSRAYDVIRTRYAPRAVVNEVWALLRRALPELAR